MVKFDPEGFLAMMGRIAAEDEAKAAAAMFRVSYETVRRRVQDGKWPAVIIGRQARFGPEEISAIRQALIKRSRSLS